MSYDTIGTAERAASDSIEREGVSFYLPYGEGGHDITLSDSDMDQLLEDGFKKILGNRALSGFDYTIELEKPDLPLFVGTRSINTEPKPSHSHDVEMGVAIVTTSLIYEHRGILLASRTNWDGSWDLTSYEPQPPLKEDPALSAHLITDR